MDNLLLHLHGAHYVHYDEELEIVAVWHGSGTFNVYSTHPHNSGDCIDAWTISYASDADKPDVHRARQSIEEHLASQSYGVG